MHLFFLQRFRVIIFLFYVDMKLFLKAFNGHVGLENVMTFSFMFLYEYIS